MADPHALTVGIHIRSGFADGLIPTPGGADSSAPPGEEEEEEEEEAREAWRLASDEWHSLVEAAVDCALALEVIMSTMAMVQVEKKYQCQTSCGALPLPSLF